MQLKFLSCVSSIYFSNDLRGPSRIIIRVPHHILQTRWSMSICAAWLLCFSLVLLTDMSIALFRPPKPILVIGSGGHEIQQTQLGLHWWHGLCPGSSQPPLCPPAIPCWQHQSHPKLLAAWQATLQPPASLLLQQCHPLACPLLQ